MSDTPEGSGRGSSSSGSDRQRESDRLRSVASSANTASHFNDRHTEYHWELDESTRRASVAATKLYDPGVGPQQWPIVYHRNYDVSFGGIEKLHPFDAGKWGKIYQFLKDAKMVTDTTTVRPMEASGRDLRVVHTEKYLKSLKCSCIVAGIIEVPPVACLPNCLVDRYALKAFRYHTGGTILAAKLALERTWAINLGGGFHHCSKDRGGGFCVYADITLALEFLFLQDVIHRAMIVDLDAHQGNGHERDFTGDSRVYIFDMFNYQIYPGDFKAKTGISRSVRLRIGATDGEYLRELEKNLTAALGEFPPDLMLYNAGTDCLANDPLGRLDISPEGIMKRDELVFSLARMNQVPIVMVTSGGYQRSNARLIADSILNLHTKKLITAPPSSFSS